MIGVLMTGVVLGQLIMFWIMVDKGVNRCGLAEAFL